MNGKNENNELFPADFEDNCNAFILQLEENDLMALLYLGLYRAYCYNGNSFENLVEKNRSNKDLKINKLNKEEK